MYSCVGRRKLLNILKTRNITNKDTSSNMWISFTHKLSNVQVTSTLKSHSGYKALGLLNASESKKPLFNKICIYHQF